MKTAQDRLDFYAARHARQRQRAENSPQDQAASFFASVYGHYLQEAEDERIIEQRARAGELLELCFMGSGIEARPPLRAMLDIVDPLERCLAHAARRLHGGEEDVGTAQPERDRDLLGLELAGLETGSARAFILADNQNPPFGHSLFEAVAKGVFRLLNAREGDFFDAANAVGWQAVQCVGAMLAAAAEHNVALEMSCRRDLQPWLSWRGTADEINRVQKMIQYGQREHNNKYSGL